MIDADAPRPGRAAPPTTPATGARPPVVRLAGAVCLVARYPVLAGVDLEVAEGEIVLVSGPNGAGKTSLLRLLAGLVPPAAGTAEVLGHDLGDGSQRRAVRRHLAYLGHDTGCYDDLSVRDNLRFAARAVGRSDARAAAESAIAEVGLARQVKVAHRRLSAGQKRRLALGVALVRDAHLLLLDEPHAGLDADGRDLLEALVRRASDEGRTVVFSSHELDRARALAHREVRMRAGETRVDGRHAACPVPVDEPLPVVAAPVPIRAVP